MRLLKQSSTAQPLLFLMIDSTAHIAGKTGLSPTVTLSKNGGSFASPSGSVTEIANGWYKVAGNATDTGTLGPLVLHATGTGADPVDVEFEVVAFDPQDSVRLGLTSLPNAAADAAGGLPISDAGGLDLDTLLAAVTAQISELSVGVPSATPTPQQAIMLLYMALRNNIVVNRTAGELQFYNNAGTKIVAKAIADDGDVYTESEMA